MFLPTQNTQICYLGIQGKVKENSCQLLLLLLLLFSMKKMSILLIIV